MLFTVLQMVLTLGFPYLAQRLNAKIKAFQWLSPVLLCYAVGILIANLKLFTVNTELAHQFTQITILLAIPLLLFSTDVPKWLSYARNTILSFLLCVLSGVIITILMSFFFYPHLENTWQYAGMMLGLLTGGAPNMQAIGFMLKASEETIVLVNAADIFCGGIYLIFLSSIAHRFFGLFLPDFQQDTVEGESCNRQFIHALPKHYGIGLFLSIFVGGLAAGITYLVIGDLSSVILLLLSLTTLSIALSFIPFVRQLPKTFELGEYLLLIFCIAIGLLADFSSIIENGLMVISFMSSIWLGIVALHSLLAYFFKIDRDTVIITSTASLYGPAFVGQVASAIGNKKIVFSGMATGLIGYAFGNYLGVGVAYLLHHWLN